MPSHTEEERRKRKKEEPEPVLPEEEPAVFRDPKTGRVSGVEIGGRTFLGLSPEEAELAVQQEKRRKAIPEGAEEISEQAERREEVAGLEKRFEERGVFKKIVQEPIISPEQENLGVIVRIGKNLLPKSLTKTLRAIDTIGGRLDFSKKKPIPQAEITTIAEDIRQAVVAETSAEIDVRIEDTEQILLQQGIPLLPIITGAIGVIAAGTILRPIGEFVGTDGQIASLELALSQYNEMITIPSRSLTAGLAPSDAFDKLDRMEDGILALESELRRAALTSPKVALALRGRGVDARLIKLKEKLQEGRRTVAFRITQEAFGEVELSKSLIFLRNLQNERKERE